MANTLRVDWTFDQLCHSCFYTAMRTRGICPNCGHDGVLPGRRNLTDDRPECLLCAGIPGNFTCRTCHQEGEPHRRGECARCALRDDLCTILLHHPADPAAMATLIEVLCGVDRPESILTWKRNVKILQLSGGIASGAIPLTHEGPHRSRIRPPRRSSMQHPAHCLPTALSTIQQARAFSQVVDAVTRAFVHRL
jgi:hypothetical protein